MTWNNRILLLLILAGAAIALVQTGRASSQGLARAQQEYDALAARNSELAREIRTLQQEVSSLRPREVGSQWDAVVDRELARIARDDLHMARPGEVVFEIQDVKAQR